MRLHNVFPSVQLTQNSIAKNSPRIILCYSWRTDTNITSNLASAVRRTHQHALREGPAISSHFHLNTLDVIVSQLQCFLLLAQMNGECHLRNIIKHTRHDIGI